LDERRKIKELKKIKKQRTNASLEAHYRKEAKAARRMAKKQ